MQSKKIENIDELMKDQRFIISLSRGLNVLSCFTGVTEPLSHQQICEATGLAKATVTRLIFTLISMNYLIQDSNGKYLLGREAVLLSNTAFTQYDVVKLISPQMLEFAEKYQVSVNLAIHQAGMMTYLIAHRSPSKISVNLQAGSQIPLEQTAIGRAYFANSDMKTQKIIVDYIAARDHEQIEKIKKNLEKHADFYKKNGFSISHGDFSSEILAIAVAIPSKDGAQVTYSLNASVPSGSWNEEEYIKYLETPLKQLALDIADAI